MKIKEAIKSLAGESKDAITTLVLCKVLSVDTSDATCSCEPLTGGAPYNVRLRSIAASNINGMLLVPDIDSIVVIATIGRNTGEALVVAYSDVTSVSLHNTKGGKLEITDDTVIINGDTHGGMVIVSKLVNKLNALENALTQLITSFNSHTHMVAAVPANATIPTVTPTVPFTASVSNTTINDLENKKVKHGNG
jgi:hypothetical protein